jgi:tetratricopeptide (TPR) repeat protein
MTNRLFLVIVLFGCVSGCAFSQLRVEPKKMRRDVLNEINKLRQIKGLPLLEYNEILNKTAMKRAEQTAAKGEVSADNNRLPTLIAAGAYARFALAHALTADDVESAIERLKTDPLAKGKILHPNITHVGLGYASRLGTVYLALDFARLVSRVKPIAAVKALQEQLQEKREKNSLEPLVFDNHLTNIAADITTRFMKGEATSDALIAEAQAKLEGDTFSFGRVTIAFQVAPDLGSVVIPERCGDPALGFTGIGVAQGNHREHESGAVAVAFLLAEPQNAHDASRPLSDLPPPKAAPKSQTVSKASLSDQAWLATLTGNHPKAARLFEKAFRKFQKPAFLYEAARAHVRNGDLKSALKDMRLYAEKVEGEEKKQANSMVALLKAGKTIFTASEKEKMSAEAKRFFIMGQSLFQKGEWDGAVDAFQQAFKYSPHPEIIYNIGLAHHRAGRIGEALDFFGEYQRLVPEATNVDEARQFFEIGVELYKTGRFEAASKHFAMAYSFLPFPELVYNLALCYKAMNENEKALRFFREYLENDLPKKERERVMKEIKSLAKE